MAKAPAQQAATVSIATDLNAVQTKNINSNALPQVSDMKAVPLQRKHTSIKSLLEDDEYKKTIEFRLAHGQKVLVQGKKILYRSCIMCGESRFDDRTWQDIVDDAYAPYGTCTHFCQLCTEQNAQWFGQMGGADRIRYGDKWTKLMLISPL
jgi:hypothetical protein